jgi:alpha-beta hydrolase superfamily lysophospholipase
MAHPGRRPRRPFFTGTSLVLVLGGLLTACTTAPGHDAAGKAAILPPVAAAASAHGVPAFYTPPRPLPAGAPGTLIRAQRVDDVPGVPGDATVWRILYRSRSIYGADIAVSGYVVIPPGPAPRRGFPVIAWAHGTTGVAHVCAPSLFNTLEGQGPYLMPDIGAYLRAGDIVAATDYQGLGTPGIHPYLLGESEGRGVLDAARAAALLPGTHASRTVLIYGHSQGGQAALFAGELAPTYAPELRVVGVVAAAPATDLRLIVSVADTAEGQSVLLFELPALYSWAETYRDLPLSDIFTPSGAALAATLVDTGCQNHLVAAVARAHITPADLYQPDVDTNGQVLAHGRLNDPGRRRTAAPLLVVQGTADTTVPPALTNLFVTTVACPVGDRIDYVHVTGATHGQVVFQAVPVIMAWMAQRLRTAPAPTTCGRAGDATTFTP